MAKKSYRANVYKGLQAIKKIKTSIQGINGLRVITERLGLSTGISQG